MLKKIMSDCTAYYTVLVLKQYYELRQKQCHVLTCVSNLVLFLSRHTSSHGLVFGVRELRVMMTDNLEEKLQLLLILG